MVEETESVLEGGTIKIIQSQENRIKDHQQSNKTKCKKSNLQVTRASQGENKMRDWRKIKETFIKNFSIFGQILNQIKKAQ